MPTVSERQRRAMYAAAEGKSKLGIPQEVGKEFVAADSANSAGDCAGIMYRSDDGLYLLLKRTDNGKWEFAGGHIENEETPEDAAIREANEEIGAFPKGDILPFMRTPVFEGNGTYHLFIQHVDTPFKPKLNPEHSRWVWAKASDLPPKVLPPVEKAIALSSGTEMDIAKRIKSGDILSPQFVLNSWLFDMRITGTGTSYRTAHDEYVYRPPENFLTDEFVVRCNGLPVIFDHPENTVLDSDEFKERAVGTIVLPYIKDDEVRGIAKIFDKDAAALMIAGEYPTTSPAVVFRKSDEAKKIDIDGEDVLIEGIPSYLDHLAICKNGVWDKGGEPNGINIGKDDDMADHAETLKAIADSLADLHTKIDSHGKRLDALDGEEKEPEETKADDAGEEIEKAIEAGKEETEAQEEALEEVEEKEDNEKGDAVPEDAEIVKRGDVEGYMAGGTFHPIRNSEGYKSSKSGDDSARKGASHMNKALKKRDSQDSTEELKAKIAAMETRIATLSAQPSHEERDALAKAQLRADSVMQLFGERASAPLLGESVIAYRKRLAAALQKKIPSLKGIRLDAAEGDNFEIIEGKIYADAQVASRADSITPTGTVREIKRNIGGREVIEYVGSDMGAFLNKFKPQLKKIGTIGKQVTH